MVAPRQRGERGEGSIQPHVNGGFRVRLTINGIKKSRVVATRAEARDQIRWWKNASDEGKLVAGAKTDFATVMEAWFKAGCKDTPLHDALAVSTVQGYRQKADGYILHAPISAIKLNALTGDHIGQFVLSLADGTFAESKTKKLQKVLDAIKITDPKQHSKRTKIKAQMPKRTHFSTSIQRQCYAVIRDVLRYAVAQKLVSRNVALDYKPPGAETVAERDAGLLTPEEADRGYRLTTMEHKRVMAAVGDLSDAKKKLRWTLALVYGIRPGEALGICHGDVNFERRELVIRRQVQPLTGKGTIIVHRVKTPSGSRTVPLHDDTVALLKKARRQKIREKHRAGWTQYRFEGREYDLVFTQENGDVTPPRLDDTNWKRFLKTARVDSTRRYVARHNAASQMMAMPGVDHISVASIMGHADPTFTWKKYSHPLDTKKRTLVDAMGDSARESIFEWKETLEHQHGREWMIANGITPNQWDEDGELIS